MKTVNHAERQRFSKYDDAHHLLYVNEQVVTFTPGSGNQDGEAAEPVEGYAYTGDMEDGSTMIDATEVTDENRRAKYIAGLIGKRYSADTQIAILANGADTEAHARELAEFNDYRKACKQEVDELLSR
jgi:hypothetical protein